MDGDNKMMRNLIFALLAGILMVGFAGAAGVASQYWEDNPVRVNGGQSGTVSLFLQNMVGEEDLVFAAEFEQNDGGIASLDKTEYEVPAGRKDIEVKLNYNIPQDARPGEKYTVRLLFTTKNPYVEGGIRTGAGMGKIIPFEVVEAPVQASPPKTEVGAMFYVYLGIVVVVAGAIVYFVMRRKK